MPQKENDNRAESKLQIIESYLTSKYDMRYNTISGEPEYRELGTDKLFTPIDDNSLYRELEHRKYRCSLNDIKCLMRSNFLEKYNPIEEYFKNLIEYDPNKEPDYLFILGDYLRIGNSDSTRFLEQFKKFIVRCVACSLYGVVNKQALIIISQKQNCGKSTFCRWLCPPNLSGYMQENINADKDSLIALTTNFLINMDELATLSKWDLDGLKSSMSRDIIKIRKPYDAKPSTYKRTANFVGSTNNIEFLTDATGSVRWLCFEVENINFKYKTDISIDRLWAQAYYLLNNGFKYQMTSEDQEQNEVANKRYNIQSIEEELICSLYIPGSIDDNDTFLLTNQIIKNIMEENPHLSNKISEMKISKALIKLGFKRVSGRVSDKPNSTKGFYVKFNN